MASIVNRNILKFFTLKKLEKSTTTKDKTKMQGGDPAIISNRILNRKK